MMIAFTLTAIPDDGVDPSSETYYKHLSNVVYVGRANVTTEQQDDKAKSKRGDEKKRHQRLDVNAKFKSDVMSRQHCKFSFGENGELFIIDLSSHHGTFVSLKPSTKNNDAGASIKNGRPLTNPFYSEFVSSIYGSKYKDNKDQRAVDGGAFKKLQPYVKHVLHDGDLIRFGKDVFKDNKWFNAITVSLKLVYSRSQPLSQPKPTGRSKHDVICINSSPSRSTSPIAVSASASAPNHKSSPSVSQPRKPLHKLTLRSPIFGDNPPEMITLRKDALPLSVQLKLKPKPKSDAGSTADSGNSKKADIWFFLDEKNSGKKTSNRYGLISPSPPSSLSLSPSPKPEVDKELASPTSLATPLSPVDRSLSSLTSPELNSSEDSSHSNGSEDSDMQLSDVEERSDNDVICIGTKQRGQSGDSEPEELSGISLSSCSTFITQAVSHYSSQPASTAFKTFTTFGSQGSNIPRPFHFQPLSTHFPSFPLPSSLQSLPSLSLSGLARLGDNIPAINPLSPPTLLPPLLQNDAHQHQLISCQIIPPKEIIAVQPQPPLIDLQSACQDYSVAAFQGSLGTNTCADGAVVEGRGRAQSPLPNININHSQPDNGIGADASSDGVNRDVGDSFKEDKGVQGDNVEFQLNPPITFSSTSANIEDATHNNFDNEPDNESFYWTDAEWPRDHIDATHRIDNTRLDANSHQYLREIVSTEVGNADNGKSDAPFDSPLYPVMNEVAEVNNLDTAGLTMPSFSVPYNSDGNDAGPDLDNGGESARERAYSEFSQRLAPDQSESHTARNIEDVNPNSLGPVPDMYGDCYIAQDNHRVCPDPVINILPTEQPNSPRISTPTHQPANEIAALSDSIIALQNQLVHIQDKLDRITCPEWLADAAPAETLKRKRDVDDDGSSSLAPPPPKRCQNRSCMPMFVGERRSLVDCFAGDVMATLRQQRTRDEYGRDLMRRRRLLNSRSGPGIGMLAAAAAVGSIATWTALAFS